jgi:hypothetical protein
MDSVGIVALRLPGLAHRLAHDGPEAARALVELRREVRGLAALDAIVLVTPDADRAVARALEILARRPDVAAAVGAGPCLLDDGHPIGAEALRVRAMLTLARVGECFATPAAYAAVTLPEGVGAFLAPAPVSEALGHPVHVLRDYR